MKIAGFKFFSFKEKFGASTSKAIVAYEIALLILMALNLGFYFYLKYLGLKPSVWLFNNPPFNSIVHSYGHWGANPWKWHEGFDGVIQFFTFFVALVGCILFFIADLLVIVLSFVLYLILKVLCYIAGGLLVAIMYASPAVLALIAIFFSIGYHSDAKGQVNIAATIIYIILYVAATTACYLFAFVF